MSWFGKIVGGSVGFMIGGPIGAVMGAVLGHGLDTMAEQHNQLAGAEVTGESRRRFGPTTRNTLSNIERSQYVFFVTTFSLLAKMAKADGVVTKDEIQTVDQFIRNNLGRDPAARDLAVRIFSEAKASPHSFESFAQQFQETFSTNPQMLLGMLEILYRVAMADGVLHPAEERLLKSAEQIFHITEGDAKRVRKLFIPDTDKHYAVLGCSPTDSMETIKSKYRALTRDYHPDKIVSKGLPDEFVEFANRKLQDINEAYTAIKQLRSV